jgi:hypothetical protein
MQKMVVAAGRTKMVVTLAVVECHRWLTLGLDRLLSTCESFDDDEGTSSDHVS